MKVVVLNILTPYKFEVTIIAERGFKSIDLFKFIDETLKWKYCIRCTKDMGISIAGKRKIKKLDDITSRKGFTKYFYNIKLLFYIIILINNNRIIMGLFFKISIRIY